MTLSEGIEGVAARRPEWRYECALPSRGSALLARGAGGALHTGALTLTLLPEVARALAVGGAPEVAEVEIGLQPWLQVMGGMALPDATPGVEHWRALLVDHRLLARPELLVGAAPAKELDAGAAEALRALRDQYQNAIFRERQRRYAALRCPACYKAHEAKTPPPAPVPRRAPREPWYGAAPPPSPPTDDCPHIAVAADALRALCEGHPELAFELVGWIEPERLRLQGKGTEAPRRFVLGYGVFLKVLGRWLLGRVPDRYSYQGDRWGYGLGYGPYGRPQARRPYYAVRARGRSEAGALPEEQRAALGFAAHAWGIAAPIEQLAWSPAAAPEGAAAPGLATEVDPGERFDVPRVLPEVVPAPPAVTPVTKKPAKKPAQGASKKPRR